MTVELLSVVAFLVVVGLIAHFARPKGDKLIPSTWPLELLHRGVDPAALPKAKPRKRSPSP